MTKKKYIVVMENLKEAFEDRVCEKMDEGYSPVGGLSVNNIDTYSDKRSYAQAMVLIDEKSEGQY